MIQPPWHYECDGKRGGRTHYAVRGVERREFGTAREALKFVVRENNRSDIRVVDHSTRRGS